MKIHATLSHLWALPVALAIFLCGFTGASRAEDSWQERMLFSPPASQLALERRGRVVIYDGLKDTQVTRAMDTQFDRIQSMMFVRTIATDAEGEIQRDQETGNIVVEDDGC